MYLLVHRYLYTEETIDLATENVMEVIYCAKKYRVSRLLKQCRIYAQDHVTANSACSVLFKARTQHFNAQGRHERPKRMPPG